MRDPSSGKLDSLACGGELTRLAQPSLRESIVQERRDAEALGESTTFMRAHPNTHTHKGEQRERGERSNRNVTILGYVVCFQSRGSALRVGSVECPLECCPCTHQVQVKLSAKVA